MGTLKKRRHCNEFDLDQSRVADCNFAEHIDPCAQIYAARVMINHMSTPSVGQKARPSLTHSLVALLTCSLSKVTFCNYYFETLFFWEKFKNDSSLFTSLHSNQQIFILCHCVSRACHTHDFARWHVPNGTEIFSPYLHLISRAQCFSRHLS